jgi:hypothetical protein
MKYCARVLCFYIITSTVQLILFKSDSAEHCGQVGSTPLHLGDPMFKS